MSLLKRVMCTVFAVIILIYSTPTLAAIPMYDTPTSTVAPITQTVFVRSPVNVFDAAALLSANEQVSGFLDMQLNPLERGAGLWSLVNFDAIPNVVGNLISGMLGVEGINEGILKIISASSSSREAVKRVVAS